MTEPIQPSSNDSGFFNQLVNGVKGAVSDSIQEVSTTIESVRQEPLKAAGTAYLAMGPLAMPLGMYRVYKRVSGKVENVAALAGALWRGSVRDVAKQATTYFINKTAHDVEDGINILAAKGGASAATTVANAGRTTSFLGRVFRFFRGSGQVSKPATPVGRSASATIIGAHEINPPTTSLIEEAFPPTILDAAPVAARRALPAELEGWGFDPTTKMKGSPVSVGDSNPTLQNWVPGPTKPYYSNLPLMPGVQKNPTVIESISDGLTIRLRNIAAGRDRYPDIPAIEGMALNSRQSLLEARKLYNIQNDNVGVTRVDAKLRELDQVISSLPRSHL